MHMPCNNAFTADILVTVCFPSWRHKEIRYVTSELSGWKSWKLIGAKLHSPTPNVKKYILYPIDWMKPFVLVRARAEQ